MSELKSGAGEVGGTTLLEDPWETLTRLAAAPTLPPSFNFVHDVFDKYAVLQGGAKALCVETEEGTERVWTYEGLRQESLRTAALLQALLGSESPSEQVRVVLVLLPNLPEYWFLLLAALRVGAVFSPGTLQLSASDIAYRVTQARPLVVVTDAQSQAKVDLALSQANVQPPPKKVVVGSGPVAEGWLAFQQLFAEAGKHVPVTLPPQTPAYIFFTSGTTGKPKMVVHTLGSYGLGNFTSSKHMKLKRDDVHFGISDPGWVAALFSTFGAWNVGACLYVNQMARFTVDRVVKILQTRAITSLFAPPTFIRALLQDPKFSLPFKALRKASCGGEALSGSLQEAWKARTSLPLHQLYGQTETTFSAGFSEDEEPEVGSLGRGMHGYRIGILDTSGQELEAGTTGNLGINLSPPPHGLFLGYMSRTPEDKLEIRRPSTGDWFLSGDVGYRTKEGFLYFVSREDDIIISAAYRIGPAEVEEVLNSHPSVRESAVVAAPNELRGHVVKAFVVLRNESLEPDLDEMKLRLQSHAKAHTAPYKYPREIEFVTELPKTPSGKIIRSALRNGKSP